MKLSSNKTGVKQEVALKFRIFELLETMRMVTNRLACETYHFSPAQKQEGGAMQCPESRQNFQSRHLKRGC